MTQILAQSFQFTFHSSTHKSNVCFQHQVSLKYFVFISKHIVYIVNVIQLCFVYIHSLTRHFPTLLYILVLSFTHYTEIITLKNFENYLHITDIL